MLVSSLACRETRGNLTDRSCAYWLFSIFGYGLIAAIPFIGFTLNTELVMAFLITERFGEALRSPSRDAVVSIVSKDLGSGRAIGLHEAIDQIGAMIGSLVLGRGDVLHGYQLLSCLQDPACSILLDADGIGLHL